MFEQLKHLRSYNNSREISSTLELVREELFASDFAQQLDANPDIMNVKNGVLLLKTVICTGPGTCAPRLRRRASW